jgi:hypothetical protein
MICFRTSSKDYLKDTMDIGKNIIVPESQNAKSLSLEPGITPLVLVAPDCMLSSVKLDHDPFLKADEVYDILSYGLLPLEFQAIHPFRPKVLPQEMFCISGAFSQFPGTPEINSSHTPHPAPLPQGERGLIDHRLRRDAWSK